jgi:hypothetical protein
MDTAFEVFADGDGIALLLHGASIVEGENGELAPGCKLTAEQALDLAEALVACSREIAAEA